MKTLKWFSLELDVNNWLDEIFCYLVTTDTDKIRFTSTEQAFDWLEKNGYIEKD